MSIESNPAQVYTSRIRELNILLENLSKKKTQIAWLRFGAVVAAFGACYLLWPNGILIALAAFAIFFALFLRLVVLDIKNKTAIENTITLITINKEEIKIAGHDFTHRDDGSRFLPPSHNYANDLDIFGRASLYQYINRTTSEQGNKTLAAWLTEPADEEAILNNQEAAKELTPNIAWRQQLQAFGISDHLTIATEDKIMTWLKEDNFFLDKPFWKFLRFLLPAIILSCLVLCIVGIIPTPIFFGIAFIFFIAAGAISRKIMPVYDNLNKIAVQIETLSNSAGWIESISFKSILLRKIQSPFSDNKKKASADIKQLKGILDRFDIRLNPLVFIPLNTLLFWDLQQAFALEYWKESHKEKAEKWFSSLGKMEAFSSIANVAFNHPSWVFPVISNEPGLLAGEEIGHPLIDQSKRVTSSFATTGLKQLALITGSNMAGKSTFLRSIGVNIVLAMMGAPVCAKSFTLYPTKVMSSMRIADNLEESTSTFYAELKKLKSIIEAVNRNDRIFILLDEILRGTNSLDRYTGSKALIKQLIHHQATGMIATHDLELAKLSEEFPANIHNYHFDVQVSNDELFFDYKLKDGVCQSMNASILMKKIGIEL
ncbi:MAG: MutS family DNA mismatch repair protein [Bacteroidota bacterium]